MRPYLSTCLALLLISILTADTIVFDNGDTLTGTFKTMQDGKITFTSDILGDVTVDSAHVSALTTTEPVSVHLAEDDIRLTPITPAQPGFFYLDDDDIPHAYTDVIAMNLPVEPPVTWTGDITAAFAAAQGDNYSRSAQLDANLNRRTSTDRLRIFANYFAERDKNDLDEEFTTEENFLIGGQYDIFLSDALFTFLNASYKTDHIADLDQRIITGLGLGWQLIDQQDMHFAVEAGIAHICERYIEKINNRTVITNSDEVTLELGYEFDWTFIEGFTFLHHMTYYPTFASLSDYFLTTDAQLRAQLNDHLFANFTAALDYDSTPAQQNASTNTRYLLGLGFNF